MYIFAITKGEDIDDVQFRKALFSTRQSIESILFGYELEVSIEDNKILISFSKDEIDKIISFAECKKKIKPAFKYCEFAKVVPSEA